ncbi:unnamed protein product [Brachionus calyciflorus]|uniref:SWIM-type domain-containing protein n=1 Tax=Brachionus calyciflorus TaxID=104777 RepID=A0A813TG05_9BILA|nr:unnamed protein product [Brachionus calyciflorus]
MTNYYSKCQSEFSLESKIDSKTKQYSSKITKSSFFKQIESSTWEFKDELNTNRFKINVEDKHCECKYYLKYKICSHYLALKEFLDSDQFINKPKRGGQKKSGPALEKNSN